MTSPLRVVGLCGSLRRQSLNRGLLEAAVEVAPSSMSIEPFEIGALPHYNADLDLDGERPAAVEELKERLDRADGLLITTPEYNLGISGVLKTAIDWASRPSFRAPLTDLPVAMMGASPGAAGTARAQTILAQILRSCLAHPMPHRGVAVGRASDRFVDGRLTDERTRDFVADYLEAFAAYIHRLRD
ncbi:MAG: NAD(P)H-dependent oxidoreductase [Acidobacteriota bacterium]